MRGKYEAPRGGKGSGPSRTQPENRRKPEQHRQKKQAVPVKKKGFPWGRVILLLVLVAGLTLFAMKFGPELVADITGDGAGTTPGVTGSPTQTNPGDAKDPKDPQTPATVPPTEPLTVESTATLAATGDVLMHMPVINTGRQPDGSYNFDSIFQYLTPYSSEADYAVANLETTLCGTENGYKYSGYPCFNSPDEIVDALLTAGFDMLTTVNNHTYDTSLVGVRRTLEVLEQKGMASLGTQSAALSPKFQVQDVNGIKLGLAAYTYETADDYPNRPSLNGILTSNDSLGMINSFDYNQLDKFYGEMTDQIENMRAAGAEAIVIFMHWGDEYHLSPNDYQTTIAQKLCDLGVDVIIGGHPHVIQPVDLLTSTTDPNHRMVCLYSMGNCVSNQRLGNLSSISTAHTEDGLLFRVRFAKYSDGTVAIDNVNVLPCWVNMITSGARRYPILPLDPDTMDQWKELYSLSDTGFNSAKKSYDRTMELVAEGVDKANAWVEQARVQHEQDYLSGGTPEPTEAPSVPSETAGNPA